MWSSVNNIGFDFDFPHEHLKPALAVSLLSVWVLVGLFYYLNRYTKRRYFTIWTAAWLFYALWLTLCMAVPDPFDSPLLEMAPEAEEWLQSQGAHLSVALGLAVKENMNVLGGK